MTAVVKAIKDRIGDFKRCRVCLRPPPLQPAPPLPLPSPGSQCRGHNLMGMGMARGRIRGAFAGEEAPQKPILGYCYALAVMGILGLIGPPPPSPLPPRARGPCSDPGPSLPLHSPRVADVCRPVHCPLGHEIVKWPYYPSSLCVARARRPLPPPPLLPALPRIPRPLNPP